MNKSITSEVGYGELKNILVDAARDFLKQDPENCPEYRSGFISGMEWALKKLKKSGLLNIKKD